MKYSYSWLKELSGTKLTAEKAAELLTMHSFELEGMEKNGSDSILEIKVLPDRAHDAMSYVGVAREIAALSGKKMSARGGSAFGGIYDFDNLKLPRVGAQFIAPKQKRARSIVLLQIQIKDKKLCPRYVGAIMKNIEIKDSPRWMQERLKIAGINVINNVVDATNYVMLELGQPLHAFDSNKLRSQNIVVRKANKNEKIKLLDDAEIELDSNDLLITDGENPLALAGIKGGKMAEIDNNTKTIILEAANFDAVNIRKTRMRHNLKTESSDRFEKDIDPNLAEKAMARLIEILEHTASAHLEEIIDIYPNKIKPWKIKLDLNYVDKLLGENIPKDKAIKILDSLDLKAVAKKNIIIAEIPTFRIDLKTQEDLIEEIGRVWGYEKIKPEPLVESVILAEVNEYLFFERKIKSGLIGLGFDEMQNYSFYGEKDTDICGLEKNKHFELENPMNPNQKYVRTSLIPVILKNIRENIKHFENLKIFETGKVYSFSDNGVKEKRMLVMAQVLEKDKSADTFFNLKGAAEDLLESLGISNGHFVSIMDTKCPQVWHPARSAEIKINGESVGIIGEINPRVLVEYKIEKKAAMAEFDLEKLLKISQKEKIYRPISKFPVITRDISLLTGENNTVEKIINQIKKIEGSLILDVKIFDVFKKDNKTSLAFHITLGDNKTLESAEVDKVMEKIISGLEKELEVEVRK